MKVVLVVFTLCFASFISFGQQYPSGSEVAKEALAKAYAEKAKNDAIVAKQREAEKKAAEKKAAEATPKKNEATRPSQTKVIAK